MSLYEDIGVPKGASEHEIRRAYRRKAQKHHPDKGGDPEAFRQVQRAYDVLGDSTRRLLYDQTGEIPPQGSDSETLSAIAQLVISAVDAMDVDHTDIIAAMRGSLQQGRQQMAAQIQQVEQQSAKRRRAVARIKRGGEGPNVLAQIIEAEIAKSALRITSCRDEIEKINRVEAALKDYAYMFDPVQHEVVYHFATGSWR